MANSPRVHGPCEVCGHKRRLYFTCSLKREIEGKPKNISACRGCEDKIAHENVTIDIGATKLNMTVAEYVKNHKKREVTSE